MRSYQRWVDWLDEARDDLDAAIDLMRLGRYSKACYFAQQAAKKALKALLIKRLNRYEHTYSVRELLEILRNNGVDVGNDLIRIGDELDRYYVPTRYPNAWPSGAPHKHYTEEDARRAVDHASRVVGFVESNL
ncbi:HEPN domain-containing protein [Vulcanisaeta distributa]|uniref:HEPN domain protein n=1 Tax=Vulcanisaeta distributa (strain DSM 14429 / JCM 11212 / NBRC 100878 / IC-017) TaxID=572478 RepID=E1QTE4_VULDI|nr:HEPN domain-containing protein [Vulcanisaeta distributa]ADN50937.1 HEPN domain protein [Vulcanisaeta distributa DSM 14429]